MIDRSLPGPVAQPFNIPPERTLWLSGERDGLRYAVYVSTREPSMVAVVERDGVTVREVASVHTMVSAWINQIVREMEGP